MRTPIDVYKAFSDETRLRIMNLLREGELCVCELMVALQIRQSLFCTGCASSRSEVWSPIDRKESGSFMLWKRRQENLLPITLVFVILGNRVWRYYVRVIIGSSAPGETAVWLRAEGRLG